MISIPDGIGGIEAVGILKKIDPDAKAIVYICYSNDPAISNFKDYGFSGVASKPYRIDELKAVLNNVLSGE